MGWQTRGAIVGVLVLWTWLLAHELPLGSDHVELFADWDHQLVEAEVAARAVHQGEAPLWNPFLCGGVPTLAKPLSRVGTPFFALHLAMEPSRALRWEIVLHLFIAAAGMALLVSGHTRGDVLARGSAALLSGMIYSGSSFFALHLTEGHLWMLTAAYLPWILAAFERGVERPVFAALAGVLLALMMGEGGALPLPLVVLLLFFYAVTLALRDRSARPIAALAIAGAVGVLISAPKLLPMLEFVGRHPRETVDQMVFPVTAVLHGLLDRDQALRRSYDWLYWGWQEQGHYVGVGVLALAVLGAARGGRVARVYAGLAVGFAVLALGPFHALAPWNLVHQIPLFSALHVTSRFMVISVLMLAALGGLGLAMLLSRLQGTTVRAAAAVLIVVGIGADLLMARQGIFGVLGERPCPMQAWPENAPRGDPIVTLTHEPRETRRCSVPGAFTRSAMVPAARAGVAIVHAYNALCPRNVRTEVVKPAALFGRARVPETLTEIRVPRNFGRKPGLYGIDDPEYRGECWFDETGAGTAEFAARTMNTQILEVDTPGPARLVMNQNWDPGWRADRGRIVEDEAGRLVIELAAATRGRVELRYEPPYWSVGWALFAAGVVAVGLAFVWDRRTPGGAGRRTASQLAGPPPQG